MVEPLRLRRVATTRSAASARLLSGSHVPIGKVKRLRARCCACRHDKEPCAARQAADNDPILRRKSPNKYLMASNKSLISFPCDKVNPR